MTKCYEAWCNPFFESECLKMSKSWNWELTKTREKFLEAGIKFDKTPEDKEKWVRKTERQPHVSQATGISEWYTPLTYLEAARKVMGSIMVDPYDIVMI